MKKLSVLLLILLSLGVVLPSFSELSAQAYSYQRKEKIVDFGVLYPIPQLKSGYSKRNRGGAAGVHYNYQFYFTDHFAWLIYPNAWFKPVLFEGKNRMLYGVNLETGLGLRAFPGSYFDPSLYLTGGIGATAAGAEQKRRSSFPVTARVGFNLWRQRDPFQDYQLAFHVYGGARHYFKVVGAMEPLMFDFGIAFRGSF